MKTKIFGALALSALVLAGCSDDQELVGANSDCTNLLGTFHVTSATVTGTGTGSTQNVNLIADSSSFDLAFGGNTFSSTYLATPGGTPSVVSGEFTTVTADKLTINGSRLFPNGATTGAFTCSVKDGVVTLEDLNSSYTFAGSSDPSPASVKITAKLHPEG